MNPIVREKMTARMHEVLAYANSIQSPTVGDKAPTVDEAMKINQVCSMKFVPLVEAFMLAAALGLKEQEDIREMMHTLVDANCDLISYAAVEHVKAL